MGALDEANWARQLVNEAGDVVSTSLDQIKTAEAINSGVTLMSGMSNAEYVMSRGGINNQGYYNDVPEYQQLTRNERLAVTNPDGTINSMAMLEKLNEKSIRAGHGSLYGGRRIAINEDNDGFATSLIDTSPTPTPPTPPPTITPAKVVVPVKTAPIDTLVIDQDAINIDFMADLIFEDIGGQELINIARNDTVNGQILSYQPIKNLTKIQQQYNPNNIVGLQNTSDKYFLNFPIKLETKLLGEGDGAGPDGAYVYIEEDTGDLIIELINLEPDEQLEVQISVSGTIYEAEFNES